MHSEDLEVEVEVEVAINMKLHSNGMKIAQRMFMFTTFI